MSPYPVHTEIWASLVWWTCCAYNHSSCEFMCAMVLLHPANDVSLQMPALPGPYNSSAFYNDIKPCHRMCNIDVHLEFTTLQLLLSTFGPVIDLCINLYLLKKMKFL